jgi:3,4-dihydroxy 2-butanone 4-phosphate synthase / GTP cyclohydrolase II
MSPSRHPAIERAIADFRRGKMVILVDDEDRENEGDLCIAAETVTPRAINFMATHGRGLICLALTEQKIRELEIPMMVSENSSSFGTAFTVSIEAREGVTTGISAKDRATTVRAAVRDGARPHDLVRPGHVFPLRARDGGVLVRTGQTEGSVDLARLAGLRPAAVICEIMNSDGTMARRPQLLRFARQHRLTVASIAELVSYRLEREQQVEALGETRLPLGEGLGEPRVLAYRSPHDPRIHLALIYGELRPQMPVLTRMHTGCATGDVFGSAQCNCGADLRRAMRRIADEGAGVIVYLQKQLRSPADILRCTHLPDPGAKGGRPDLREFGVGAQILRDLGVTRLRLLTNHPRRIVGLEGFGLEVAEVVPLAAQRGRVSAAKRRLT